MDVSNRYRWAAVALIVGAAVMRLLYLAFWCPFDLAPDEAYYWDWSRQLDWSYHSKGPFVALLIRASCELFGDTMFAVRLPAVVCGSLLLAGLFTLTSQVYRSDKLAFTVVALALTLPVVAAGTSLMTIDAPFLCAWMWALVFGHRAVFRQSRWAWPAAGLCILAGVLAKYTMVLFVPSFALFLLTTPIEGGRRFMPSGFWIMTVLGALGGVPILVWNALHGWVTITHTQTHIGFEDDAPAIRWLGPLAYVGGQFAVLLGFWFVAWVRAAWHSRPTLEAEPGARFLWWMSVPTFIFFGLFSLKNGGGEANWPLASYLAGMVLVAGWWSGREQAVAGVIGWMPRLERAGVIAFAVFGLFVTVMVHEPIYLQPVFLKLAVPATKEQPMPIRRVDPTSRLRGWRFLATEVDRARIDLQTRGIEPVLAGERWVMTGELGFYCQGRPHVYCLGLAVADRTSQYDLWHPNPIMDRQAFRGRTFLLVGLEMERLRYAFESFEPVRPVQYHENAHLVAEWTITIAHGFRGFGDVERIKPD